MYNRATTEISFRDVSERMGRLLKPDEKFPTKKERVWKIN